MTDYSNSPRDATRVPIAHRIQLKFDRFSGFINEYVSNISPGGIFIRTDSPEAPGQLLEFEFRLGDGFELIRGRGEVVWTRARPEGPERPSGMGVRFLELSPGSKDLIYKIVDDYVAHGGKPFDLSGQPAPDPPPALGAYGAAPAAGVPAPAGPQSVSWNLEIPPIRPVPGVPVITPRSPLEALAPGSGSFGTPQERPVQWLDPAPEGPAEEVFPPPAERQGPFGPVSHGAPAAPAYFPEAAASGAGAPYAFGEPEHGGTGGPEYGAAGGPQYGGAGGPAHGSFDGRSSGAFGGPAGGAFGGSAPDAFDGPVHPAANEDPFAQMSSALPPLDELTAVTRDPFHGVAPEAAPPPPPPAFAAFNQRAPRKRSPVALFALLAVLLIVCTSLFFLRDTILEWVDREAAPPTRIAGGTPPVDDAAPGTPRRPRTPPVFPEFSPSTRAARRGGLPTGPAASRAAGAALPGAAGSALSSGAAGTAGAAASPVAAGSPGAAGTPGVAGTSGAGATPSAAPSPAAGSAAPSSSSSAAMPSGPSPLPPPPSATAGAAAPGGRAAASGAHAAAASGAVATTAAASTPGAADGAGGAPPPLVRAKGAQPGAPTATPSTAAGTAASGAAAASETGGARATAIQRITWEAAHGATEVVLWGNGDFPRGSWSENRIGGQGAREVIVIRGIARPFAQARLGVNTPEVLQVRTGYHPPQELHVVLDLGRPDVAVTGIEPGPHQLRIHLGPR